MKPGTFTQMYVQLVFAVKNRDAVLKIDFRERVFEYMNEIEFDQQFLFDFWDDRLYL
jgi:hypothetical protein